MTTTVPGAGSARRASTAEDAGSSQRLSRRPALDTDATIAPTVTKAVFFVVGCALLVGCAFALDRLGAWSADYGRVWVFLGFFLVMSLGGRWFWAGADAVMGWVKDQVRR